MGEIRSHRDLIVWQRAMDLAARCYVLAEAFPPTEQFRLTAQLLRSAASVPANIAEGHARDSTKSYLFFLSIARGSLAELETFTLLAVRLRYVGMDAVEPILGLISEVSRMITTIQHRLRDRLRTAPRSTPRRAMSPDRPVPSARVGPASAP